MVNNQPVTYRHFGGDKLRTAKKQFGGSGQSRTHPKIPTPRLTFNILHPWYEIGDWSFCLCPVHLRLSHFAYVC